METSQVSKNKLENCKAVKMNKLYNTVWNNLQNC